MGYTITDLERGFGLNRSTLYSIRKGAALPSCSEYYLQKMTEALQGRQRLYQVQKLTEKAEDVEHMFARLWVCKYS